jgi:hypothetical protein
LDRTPDYDFEHGWQALAGLLGRLSTRLQRMQSADDYSAVAPWELVPVEPCPNCADGGLRTAGYVTRDHQLRAVRQCDTCHAVQIGSELFAADDIAQDQDDMDDQDWSVEEDDW